MAAATTSTDEPLPPPLTAALAKTNNQPVKKVDSGLKSFLSGGVGGICVVLVGHPLDLIKVRMQTGNAASGRSVFQIFTATFRESGVRGLYRGVSAPLVAVTPIFALSFWGYDMGQRLVRQQCMVDDLSIGQKTVAGGLSGIPTTVFMAPSERIKCLLQTSTKYTSMVSCGYHVFQTGGIRSLYRGTALTLMRDIPGSMAWFGAYELVKKAIMEWQGKTDPSQLSPVAVLTAGGMAGMACWMVSIPADVLKSRFQSAPEGTYRNSYHVFTTLLEKDGPTSLFTGIRPALIRAFPANAACFFGMEVSRKLLSFMD